MSESHFEQFTLSLASILKSIKKIEGNHMSRFDLRGSHVMALYLLRKHPQGLTPVDLAESGSVDKALVSRTIAELLKKELVYTLPSGGRKYKARLVLTAKGEEVADYVAENINSIQQQVSGDIPETDLEVFYRTLFTLQENFNELAKKGASKGTKE